MSLMGDRLGRWVAAGALAVAWAGPAWSDGSAARPFAVAIRVDASCRLGPLHPIWRFFGADEPNYGTMKDGRKLLAELGDLRPNAVYFRAHNLLTSGDGTPEEFLKLHDHAVSGVRRALPTARVGGPDMAGSDPEGCAACQGPQLAYRSGTMYSSYTAASFARKLDLAQRHGVNLEGALTWAFAWLP